MSKITMEAIQSFEDACKYKKMDPEKVLPDFSGYPKQHREAMTAHAKLVIISDAINTIENNGKAWVPDWENWDDYKYYPWFRMGSPAGVGFSYHGYDYWDTSSDVGSRLCFKSREAAIYVGKKFTDLYKAYFTI